ncbi:MAG TPA: alpha-amylase family glycosyl hydrolase [Ideonella sp.]|jgi:glycosidase|nr:alpha-amylase family glycosyl hydrolase [Ideonella sp.]
MKNPLLMASLLLASFAMNTPAAAAPTDTVNHVAWSRQATIYEVNLRQFTPEGTMPAFQAHLPRLKAMGVDILWLMPLHPIGVKNRKGTLGSYYAVKDYTAVNPEFGTLADLKALVAEAHKLGMKVIIDWVANHTAWDHGWVTQHPDWYKKNASGQIYPVTFGEGEHQEEWTDVVALDYRSPALRRAMIDAMAFWLREADIDGFRCDVASLVPTPFWEEARATLDRIKPVFMLAESDAADLHARAFDMSYDWDLGDLMKAIAQGQATAADLAAQLRTPKKRYPADAYRMTFTTNHDWNSWQGSDSELYGPAFRTFAVLAATLPGMPLLYGGQEGGLDKRVQFFEKDAIAWKGYPLAALYTELFQLKHAHPALANGSAGGALTIVDSPSPALFAFQRTLGDDRVTVVVNLSAQAQAISGHPVLGNLKLEPWGWRITP